jgi:predicted branched-subunit amino acid permease
MVGFAALAKGAGFDVWLVSATTLAVWGMPGQVAFASLYATGTSLTIIFLAVSLANMRMMLMVISGYNILQLNLHNIALWKKVLLMHIMAITSWAQISYIKDKYPPNLLLSYYIGFSITIYAFGLSGTIVGYFINYLVNTEILRAITFMTPLYILLLVINSKDKINRISVMLGGTIVPVIYPFLSEWSILLGGFLGGSIAFGFGLVEKK